MSVSSEVHLHKCAQCQESFECSWALGTCPSTDKCGQCRKPKKNEFRLLTNTWLCECGLQPANSQTTCPECGRIKPESRGKCTGAPSCCYLVPEGQATCWNGHPLQGTELPDETENVPEPARKEPELFPDGSWICSCGIANRKQDEVCRRDECLVDKPDSGDEGEEEEEPEAQTCPNCGKEFEEGEVKHSSTYDAERCPNCWPSCSDCGTEEDEDTTLNQCDHCGDPYCDDCKIWCQCCEEYYCPCRREKHGVG